MRKKRQSFFSDWTLFTAIFFVPEDKYSKHYFQHNSFGQARMLVQDEDLGVLFHNSEHLKVDPVNPEVKELFKKRNIIGWYDGRPMEILSLPEEGPSSVSVPASGRDLTPYFKFAAHKDGEFSIIVDGKEIRLDISFDDPTYY